MRTWASVCSTKRVAFASNANWLNLSWWRMYATRRAGFWKACSATMRAWVRYAMSLAQITVFVLEI